MCGSTRLPAPPESAADLAGRVAGGDRRAVARALTLVERGDAAGRALIGALFPHTGRAHVVGVTGPAGVGKSSLIARLVDEWRRRGRRVGVVAVDPSSAASGGAVLGDRVRMEHLHADRDVFVRSMASRGTTGGLARATVDATRVLDAAGFDLVVVETIGAGQDEVAIAETVETVVVVDAPNLGDDVQALKAGLAEVADVFAVNKSDLPGADRVVATRRATLALDPTPRDWSPPIVKLSAATGEGTAELADALESHLAWLSDANAARRAVRAAARARAELERLIREELEREIHGRAADMGLADLASQIATREMDPYKAAAQAIAQRAETPQRGEAVRQA